MSLEITSSLLKSTSVTRRLCVCLANAISEYRSNDTDRTSTGRNAMLRIGMFVLRDIAKPGAKVPFVNVDQMLAYVNRAKQEAAQAVASLDKLPSMQGFVSVCTILAWRKLHTDTITACETFQTEWKAGTNAKPEHNDAAA